MKKLHFIITFNSFFLFSFYSFSQSETVTLSNGVIVHEPLGVEGKVKQEVDIQNNESSSIDSWSLEICLQFREDVQNKLNAAPTEEESIQYRLKLKQIEERIVELKLKK